VLIALRVQSAFPYTFIHTFFYIHTRTGTHTHPHAWHWHIQQKHN